MQISIYGICNLRQILESKNEAELKIPEYEYLC